ncbi:MAG: hypothetical protein HN802_05845 [Candidatus Jacksonbacteria bacterium]|jgi:hypothetical protein|nr:hypothetical protein [Candidatus Jacksonbacteria bacterium]
MICPYCKKEARWCENKERYGRNYGKSYMCYWCQNCDAYVGCHQNTKRALGTMANKELRGWRMKAHASIDPIWRNGHAHRKKVYKDMKRHFGREIHIGESNIEQCKDIIKWATTPIT